MSYDPVANSWTNLGSANTGGLGNYGGVSPYGAGQLLITDGGDSTFNPSPTTHLYNIAAHTFSVGPNELSSAWATPRVPCLTDGLSSTPVKSMAALPLPRLRPPAALRPALRHGQPHADERRRCYCHAHGDPQRADAHLCAASRRLGRPRRRPARRPRPR